MSTPRAFSISSGEPGSNRNITYPFILFDGSVSCVSMTRASSATEDISIIRKSMTAPIMSKASFGTDCLSFRPVKSFRAVR